MRGREGKGGGGGYKKALRLWPALGVVRTARVDQCWIELWEASLRSVLVFR